MINGPKTGRHREVEEVVADFIRKQREAGMPVMTEIIHAKAREVGNALEETVRIQPETMDLRVLEAAR